jgi:transcriptional regulator with XRE-family HTH domain
MKLDINYTMLQKHERGDSTISAKRLLQVALALNRPLTDFLPIDGAVSQTKQLIGDDERLLIANFRGLKNDEVRGKAIEFLGVLSRAEKTG